MPCTRRLVLALLFLACSAHPALAQEKRTITEEEAAAIVEAAQAWWNENDPEEPGTWNKYKQSILRTLGGVDLARLDAAALHTLAPILRGLPFESTAPADDRLRELMRDPGAEGAVAATARLLINYIRDVDRHEQWLRDAIAHPGLGEAMRQGLAGEVWTYMGIMQPEILRALKDDVLAVESLLVDDLPPRIVLAVARYEQALRLLGDAVDEATLERVRSRLTAMLGAAIEEPGDMEPREVTMLRVMRAAIGGKWSRGELLDQSAPQMAFDAWIGSRPVATLEELRGNVVVLDVWTTWCGACIAAFPKIRKLQERFKDQPVRIIGLTWLQGTHYPRKGQPIDTQGEPDREYAAMAGLVAELELSWPVAFADVAPIGDFGVHEGVPQLIIIDAQGVVRWRRGGWIAEVDEVADMIEALLSHD